MSKTTGPCPHCGQTIVLTGNGKCPCAWCGVLLPAARQYLDTGRGDLDGAIALVDEYLARSEP